MNLSTVGGDGTLTTPVTDQVLQLYEQEIEPNWGLVRCAARRLLPLFRFTTTRLGPTDAKLFEHELRVAALVACHEHLLMPRGKLIHHVTSVLRRHLRQYGPGNGCVTLTDMTAAPHADWLTKVAMDQWIRGLTGADRVVIRHLERGDTHGDIAARLGVTRAAVTQRIARLRKELGRCLGWGSVADNRGTHTLAHREKKGTREVEN